MYTSEIVLQTLKEGNAAYVKSGAFVGDISPEKRLALTAGQSPRAVVITCADSRVIPEVIFSCGLGELFTIRIAGNVTQDVVCFMDCNNIKYTILTVNAEV